MMLGAKLRWVDGRFAAVETCDVVDSKALVVDSWLLQEGRAVSLELHLERFVESCRTHGLGPTELDRARTFWLDALRIMPLEGAWFPRLEIQSTENCVRHLLWLRPAPHLETTVTLQSYRGADVRTLPTVKGPDLEALSALRVKAQDDGLNDIVLLNTAGHILETSSAAILWWEENCLCIPPVKTGFEKISSITAKTLMQIAEVDKIEICQQIATPIDLAGKEVWVANALHGIRNVTHWTDPIFGEIELNAVQGRFESWQAKYWSKNQPLGEFCSE